MNLTETAQLLALIKQFDNRQYDRVTVAAWQEVLADIEHADAVGAVKDHVRESADYLKVAHIRAGALAYAHRRAGRQRVAEIEQRLAIEEAAAGDRRAPADRSPAVKELLAELAERLGPGKPDQLRWRDPTLFGPPKPRASDEPNPKFTGYPTGETP